MVQLACAATLLPQLLVCAKSPAIAILAMLSVRPPMLVSVTTWLGVAPPRMTLPKPIVVTLSLTTGAGTGMAIPDKPTLVVPLLLALFGVAPVALAALLVTIKLATLKPIGSDGVKLIDNVQPTLGGSVPQLLLLMVKSPPLVLVLLPLMVMPPIFRLAVPILVMAML